MLLYFINIIKLTVKRLHRKFAKNFSENGILNFYTILEHNFKEGEAFNCIIVGANDGISHDGLYKFLITRKSYGLAIEPLPYAFEKLVENFDVLPDMVPLNIAVHPSQKKVLLYYVQPQRLNDLPSWASGIASLNKDHHTKSSIPAEYMTSTQVEADHLMNILKKQNQNYQPDLLQIDAEGFDYEILKQIDFAKLNPKIIRYEYFCLDKEDEQSAINLLKSKGYFCFYDDVDVVGIKLRYIKL